MGLKLENRQRRISRSCALLASLVAPWVVLPFVEGSPVDGAWALAFVSFFAFLSLVAVALVFRKRARKMDSLLSGEELVASWSLGREEKEAYSMNIFLSERGSNKLTLFLVLALLGLVFGIVIALMGEGRLAMLLIGSGVGAVVALAAFVMPHIHRRRASRSDGLVLLGRKFAYVNGVFHNWDFPLSGIVKVKEIEKPFHGLLLRYYYVDRTLRNEETLEIPAPEDVDLKSVVRKLT